MTVEELASILNKMIADGKGNYKVVTMEEDLDDFYIGTDYILLDRTECRHNGK